MPANTGDQVVIEVQDPAVPATWVPVNDMNRLSRRTGRTESQQRVFMKTRPYKSRSSRTTTHTVSGLFNDDDAGQQILRDAMEADTPVTLRFLHDGTNGFSQQFFVNNMTYDANPDPSAFQEDGFELSDNADPVVVAAGPIF